MSNLPVSTITVVALLTYFYERFLYDDQTYTPWKYGLLHGLGFGALFWLRASADSPLTLADSIPASEFCTPTQRTAIVSRLI